MPSSFLLRLFVGSILLLSWPIVMAEASEKIDILVLGDSLTSGYGLEEKESFPAQLEEQLHLTGYNVNVINAGVSGDTSAGGLARLEWALASNPDVVIVELGGNDALRGLAPNQVQENLGKILTRLDQFGCQTILAGMKAPRNLGYEYYTDFDQLYPDLAKEYNVLFYPFFLEGVALNVELNLADRIHPNAKGVQHIVAGITPLVVSALNRVQSSTGIE